MDSDGMKVGVVPEANGWKMLETEDLIKELTDYVSSMTGESERELTRRANKALYEMAEQSGRSLWALCYQVIPQWTPVGSPLDDVRVDERDVTLTMEWQLELIPLRVDWQHGEGYWEKRYNELKQRMQQLIDERDDDVDINTETQRYREE